MANIIYKSVIVKNVVPIPEEHHLYPKGHRWQQWDTWMNRVTFYGMEWKALPCTCERCLPRE